MIMSADWATFWITFVYVVATIFICVFNGRSAKATQQQVIESQRQYEETKRLECMPFLQMEIPVNVESPLFEIELPLCTASATSFIYKNIHLKNIGNGTATNIIYTWKSENNIENIVDYLPINAVMHGDKYCLQLTFDTSDEEANMQSRIVFEYNDLLGYSYQQQMILYFEDNDLTRIDNDMPHYLGIVKYKALQEGGYK